MTNQRQHVRHDYVHELEIGHAGKTQAVRSVNISQGGMFIVADPVPAFGEKITIKLQLPGIADICEVSCLVRWSKEGAGAGLQFEQLRAIEVWALNKLLRDLPKASD